MKNLFTKIIPILPILGIFLVVLILFFTNYKPGTFLTGWDNLHPEFNVGLALKRSIFAVWQEYQSLGLLGGMGHAADIVHVITIALLKIFFPLNLVRYIFTFLMIFIGGIGAYYLINYVLGIKYHVLGDKNTDETQKNTSISLAPSFLGGVFYILNLATLQTFYVPYEAFSVHYAFLPWLLLTSIIFLNHTNKKNAFFLSIILLLASPASYIPTLFVVLILALVLFIACSFFVTKSKTKLTKSSLKLFGLIGLINSFWLLPFIYFTITNVNINLTSKINQMATSNIFAQNKEFGNIKDVALLKGFWFQNIDPNLNGEISYMLSSLKEHFSNPLVIFLGFLFFAVILLGVFWVFIKKEKRFYPLAALFLFAFTMLATATPPFSWIDILFRKLPLFEQAFRFPFTKFSILAGLMYSVFFALGMHLILKKMRKHGKNVLHYFIILITLIFLVFFSFTAFTGNFFYEKETIKIPKEYFQVFDYFKSQDKSARIANLPQHTFWGWNFYNWGYGGSGFLWYGIEQPILDRAFDPWSHFSEQYYFELSNAIYSKKEDDLIDVLNKYQVSFILLDQNTIYPQSPKALFYPEIIELLKKIPSIKKVAAYGNISIFKVDLKDEPMNSIYSAKDLSSVKSVNNQYTDLAYKNLGNYYALEENSMTYPFTPLFSRKTENENGVLLSETKDKILLSQTVPPHKDDLILQIPAFKEKENIIPVLLMRKVDNNNTTISLSILPPEISISGKKIYGQRIEFPIFVLPDSTSFPLSININAVRGYVLKKNGTENDTIKSFLALNEDNTITLTDSEGFSITYMLPSETLKSLNIIPEQITIPKNSRSQTLTITIPKILDEYLSFEKSSFENIKGNNCNLFRKGAGSIVANNNIQFLSQDTSNCIDFYLPDLLHDQGYVIFIDSKNTMGRPLHFWALNEDAKFAPVETYIANNKSGANSFVLPVMEKNGRGYSLHFDNESIGKDKSQNTVSKIGVYHIPFEFITNIIISDSKKTYNQSIVSTKEFIEEVKHPNESLYTTTIKKSENKNTLVLSQSFNKGWSAYLVKSSDSKIKNYLNSFFPFIFGEKLKNHVMVNNWSNGWIIDNQQQPGPEAHQPLAKNNNYQLIIIYLPQYLEFLGFLLLALTCLFFAATAPRTSQFLKRADNYFNSKTQIIKNKIYPTL